MDLHIDLTIIYMWAKVMGSNPVQPGLKYSSDFILQLLKLCA